jgi:large subunit ribosomal protein L18
MSNTKKVMRMRRSRKTRARLNEKAMPRITVIRSNRNIQAQLIVIKDGQHIVLASASSLEKGMVDSEQNKIDVATKVGKTLAERAQKAGVTVVAFDRSGFKYHGRIKALADAAREGGMQF